jgi:hypothetical protein
MWKLNRRLIASIAVAGAIAAAAGAAASAYGHGEHGWFARGVEHIDGRIAFLKAELKITPEQEALWAPVAAAMRANAESMAKLRDEAKESRDKPESALATLERRQRFADARAKDIAGFTAAFKPLYDRMSDDQRKAADALLQRHARRG